MANKTGNSKKVGFSLAPITLREPVKVTDGFTNLVETHDVTAETEKEETKKSRVQKGSNNVSATEKRESKKPETSNQFDAPESYKTGTGIGIEDSMTDKLIKTSGDSSSKNQEKKENQTKDFRLNETELLRILDADSVDEIYELSDVLRASSLKLYAALVRLADSRGRARVKNHELMSKAGIKGIATLYKQERWLMDLKLLEKKAKPGPHDGSSYVVHKLETLPLPAEIYEKFDEYLSNSK